jgi:hypothetical protein
MLLKGEMLTHALQKSHCLTTEERASEREAWEGKAVRYKWVYKIEHDDMPRVRRQGKKQTTRRDRKKFQPPGYSDAAARSTH